jgi:uncharacterized protein with ParB-like and HNH nuclease domain
MAFESITIKEAIDHIYKREYLLPSIQRSFEWKSEQIEQLFDSLMRGYPINSFLFWYVEEQNQKGYEFYEFLQNFHERDTKDNIKANLNGEKSITAVLDGQQRLTSLYIGLKGTFATKEKGRRRVNDAAYPTKKLYLNLLSPPTEPEASDDFDFSFLSSAELGAYEKDKDKFFWFEVGRILDFAELFDVTEYLKENIPEACPKDKQKFATKALTRLFRVIHDEKVINFFMEKGESLDKVLTIFVRINSGGTKLSFSDLLLSTATAKWTLNARDEINGFVKQLNSIGSVSVEKDFVLKSCLTLTDNQIAFKIKNFNSKTLADMESQWGEIKDAINCTVNLVKVMGYNPQTLTSNNALIPIAYYMKKLGAPANFSQSNKYENERRKISKWLKVALIKRTFSGQPDNVLIPLRDLIGGAAREKGFPYDEIIEASKGNEFAGGAKSLVFSEDDLLNLLDYEYGEPYTYSVLTFLYPTFNFSELFHQDHIFPKSLLKQRVLRESGLSQSDIEFCEQRLNGLANLQLLPGIVNQEKSKKLPNDWMNSAYKTEAERAEYRARHFIPNLEMEIKNLRLFIEERERLLLEQFRKELMPEAA